uniref:Perlwapin-like n=1 Tax=Sinocyclocheilus rhinocerous TaxID=307959 RepID=A0A673HRA6_9TELE
IMKEHFQERVLSSVLMTVTVQMIRSAAAMDVDVSVWLHIEVFLAFLVKCVELCSHDSDCPNDKKCCSKGCGRQCMPPYKEKPGVCPSKNLGLGACVEMCSQDGDCPNDEKCCSNGCGHQCMALSNVKPGVCPKNNHEGVFSGACADRCSHDSDCPKDEKCCRTKCG